VRKEGAPGVWGTEVPKWGPGAKLRAWRFFVIERLNFDVLEEKISKTSKKIPSQKIMVGWKGGGGRRKPPPA